MKLVPYFPSDAMPTGPTPTFRARHLFNAFLAAAVLYLWVIGISRFEFFIHEANLDSQLVALAPSAWALLLVSGVLVSWRIHDQLRVPGRDIFTFILRPFIHLAVAAGFWMIYLKDSHPVASLFSYWMAFTHLLISLGNLLPMLPTDSGKVLDFFMTRKWGHVRSQKALRLISRMSILFLVVAGILSLSPLILLLAGLSYARAQMILEETSSHPISKKASLRVRDVGMRVPLVSERHSILEAAELMAASRSEILPIRRLSEIAPPDWSAPFSASAASAMISLSHINRIPESQWSSTSVKEVMHPVSHALLGSQSIESIQDDLISAPYQTLPWREGQQVVGILRHQDVVDGMELLELQSREEIRHAA